MSNEPTSLPKIPPDRRYLNRAGAARGFGAGFALSWPDLAGIVQRNRRGKPGRSAQRLYPIPGQFDAPPARAIRSGGKATNLGPRYRWQFYWRKHVPGPGSGRIET